MKEINWHCITNIRSLDELIKPATLKEDRDYVEVEYYPLCIICVKELLESIAKNEKSWGWISIPWREERLNIMEGWACSYKNGDIKKEEEQEMRVHYGKIVQKVISKEKIYKDITGEKKSRKDFFIITY